MFLDENPYDYANQPLSNASTGGTFGPTIPAGTSNDWGSWFMGLGTAVTQTALNTYQYGQLAKGGAIPGVTPNGTVYTEGQRVPVQTGVAQSLGISPVLLIGGAVAIAALLLLRK